MLCGGDPAARKFHLLIIYSFLSLRHLNSGETSLMMQHYNWPIPLCRHWRTTRPHRGPDEHSFPSSLEHLTVQFKWNYITTQATSRLVSCVSQHPCWATGRERAAKGTAMIMDGAVQPAFPIFTNDNKKLLSWKSICFWLALGFCCFVLVSSQRCVILIFSWTQNEPSLKIG